MTRCWPGPHPWRPCSLACWRSPRGASSRLTTPGLTWPSSPLRAGRLARHLMVVPDEVPDRKLGTLAGFFGTEVQPSHRALADARATADVLARLMSRLADRGVSTLEEMTAWLAEQDAAEEAARAAAEAERAVPPWRRWLRALRRRLRGAA